MSIEPISPDDQRKAKLVRRFATVNASLTAFSNSLQEFSDGVAELQIAYDELLKKYTALEKEAKPVTKAS